MKELEWKIEEKFGFIYNVPYLPQVHLNLQFICPPNKFQIQRRYLQ